MRSRGADLGIEANVLDIHVHFPVGAIREKVLAAHRAGNREVLMPAANASDLVGVPADARRSLEITWRRQWAMPSAWR